MYEGYGGKPGGSTGDDANDGCDLEALATEFVGELPDEKLSSAAVQGYLLKKTGSKRSSTRHIKLDS